MSAPISLMLDPAVARVVTADGREVHSIVWSPDAPDAMADAVRAVVGSPSAIVVVVGLGFLEIAQPDLPPMAAGARRAVLWRDADRYFPLDEPIAVVSAEAFVFAVSARQLNAWVRAIGAIGPVRTIVTAPQLCALALANGEWAIPVADGERGVVQVRDHRLTSVRRVPRNTHTDDAPDADMHLLGREALRWIDAPLESQLLDATLATVFARSRQRRWLTSAVLATAAVLFLFWSVDRWRGEQLNTLVTVAALLTEQASPAVHAESRLSRAQDEVTLLAGASVARHAPDAPLVVLAQLSRILPKDAFVQRLEWDGQLWRVDGTADNARRLVPLFDGDAHFRDVRIASASQRFLDAGRQRESFAISFRTRSPAGGANGTP